MNLGDREILELNELCGAVIDGTLTEAQRARLAAWLAGSETARRFYVRALGQSASLHTYAAEMHAEAPDARTQRRFVRLPAWWAVALPVAAAIAAGIFWLGRPAAVAPATAPVAAPERANFVARITGSKDAQWAGGTKAFAPGAHLSKGERLELGAGLAEITFDSGARIVLEGAASLDVNSAWDATLRRGTLKASVPAEALGFRVSNPAVEVVDLGTEFTMIADGAGAAEVLVLKGEVEAAPHAAFEADTILLRENESRRFAESGVSDVADREQKFARFNRPLALDRFAPAGRLVHWNFDEAGGEWLRAGTVAPTAPGGFDARLHAEFGGEPATLRGEGRRGRGLRFDGKSYAQAAYPGISGGAPRTIAFWVRVAEDAPLSDAYTMVGWATEFRKLNHRPVGINWNRNPAEGPLGALRTDFAGGCAMGTTSLRDGRWHHVTVCFTPGEDDATPVQVKQYVDGRLESTFVPGISRGPGGAGRSTVADVVWFGCRLTNSGPRAEGRFRGELDEVFIADRTLEPLEIVSLMNDNRLPVAALAAK